MEITQENFLIAMEVSSDIVFSTSLRGNIMYVNPAFEQTTGYTAAEVIGKNPKFLRSQLHPPEFYKNLWDTILSGKPYRAILKNKRKNGTIYYEEKTITPVLKDEKVSHFISSGKDITERVESRLRLEKLVKELERSNGELNNYTRIVAHDLKSPLAVITMAVSRIEKLESLKLEGESLEMFQWIKDNSALMETFINDLLEYSKIGKEEAVLELVDLEGVVKNIISPAAPGKNIKYTISGDWQPLHINKLYITQVFQNLISNAIKFMDKEMGEIKISCQGIPGFWEFTITDNGPGIEDKYLDKLFSPFQKAHSRDDIQSTGIGLSIVRKIIEQLGGKITLETELGKGCTFLFTIPKELEPVIPEYFLENTTLTY